MQPDCVTDNEVVIKRAFANNLLRETTKSGKPRRFEITDFMRDVFESIPPHVSSFVFVRKDGKPYTSRDLNKIWHAACERAGVARIKMYNAFRHSLGCQLLDQGEDIDLVREQLGHSKIEMTRRYAKRSKAKLTDALNKRRKVVDINSAKKEVGQ